MSKINLNAPENWAKWIRACAKSPDHRVPAQYAKLGMCTGQDNRALHAVAACWQLYCVSDDNGRAAAIVSIRWLLKAMQPCCHPIARELIAQQMDWSDRDRLWHHVSGMELHPAVERILQRGGGSFADEDSFNEY